jgi:putative NADH-flavin reductase
MKLIVFGPTGGTGRWLLEQGPALGHVMTAFTRRPLVQGYPVPPREIIGDVLDPAAVAAAVRGHDAVLSCLGTRPWRHVDICSRGIASIIPAMQAANIKRIVAMSSIGVGEPKAGIIVRLGGAILLRKAFRDKLAMEQALEQSNREWIVVRPGFLTDGKPRGKWRAADDGSLKGGTISRADTAAFMLQQLSSNEWLRKRPVLVW